VKLSTVMRQKAMQAKHHTIPPSLFPWLTRFTGLARAKTLARPAPLCAGSLGLPMRIRLADTRFDTRTEPHNPETKQRNSRPQSPSCESKEAGGPKDRGDIDAGILLRRGQLVQVKSSRARVVELLRAPFLSLSLVFVFLPWLQPPAAIVRIYTTVLR